MPRATVFEEFHVTVRAPRALPTASCHLLRRLLRRIQLRRELRQVVQTAVLSETSLQGVRVTVTR